MRYSIIDLQIEDIMWFGIVIHGYIFACTTAGQANVPEFVCKSREETEKLYSFFTENLNITTTKILETNYTNNDLINDAILLAKKGLFSFDAVIKDTVHKSEYTKIASPIQPIMFTSLPKDIQHILANHRINIDILNNKYICVEHAYEK